MTRASRGLVREALVAILVCAWGLFAVPPASAHVFAPSLLEVRETTPSHAVVRWKQPAVRVSGSGLVPVMGERCHAHGEPTTSDEDTGVVTSWVLHCAGGLVGQTIRVEGIAASQANVLLRLVLADGRAVRHVLTADEPSFVVPARQGVLAAMVGYGRLGVDHILTGLDHLLFVLGLVLLVEGGRRLLWTVTAFTLGHSVTLTLAVLGLVHVPQWPIDLGIVLSIYVLAVELAKSKPRKPTLLERAPWFAAGLFGLFHGLGFAGALAQVGLPQGEIPLALFSFNVGIEAGQLAFVGVILATWTALRLLEVRWPPVVGYVPAYAMGTFAAFWFFQRLATSLTGVG
jgi:hydrogenase/urease accessory protein HupE